jgi:hypothetical protein
MFLKNYNYYIVFSKINKSKSKSKGKSKGKVDNYFYLLPRL